GWRGVVREGLVVRVLPDGGAPGVNGGRARRDFDNLADGAGFERQLERGGLADEDFDVGYRDGLEPRLLGLNRVKAWDEIRRLEFAFRIGVDDAVACLAAHGNFGVGDGRPRLIKNAAVDRAFGHQVLRRS